MKFFLNDFKWFLKDIFTLVFKYLNLREEENINTFLWVFSLIIWCLLIIKFSSMLFSIVSISFWIFVLIWVFSEDLKMTLIRGVTIILFTSFLALNFYKEKSLYDKNIEEEKQMKLTYINSNKKEAQECRKNTLSNKVDSIYDCIKVLKEDDYV